MLKISLIFVCVVRVFSETHFSINLGSFANSTTSTKDFCECLPFYQCSEDLTEVITDGSGLLDLRNFKDDLCIGDFDVCCNITEGVEFSATEKPPKPIGCGFNTSEAYPWTAALLFQGYDDFNPSYKCGVSIIHRKVAVTAAHCLNEDGLYAVRIGNLIRKVSKTVIHPKFNQASLHNDIALLMLEKSVDSPTICIASMGTKLDDMSCLATASMLTSINLPIVSREKCGNILRSTRLGQYFQLHHSFICAGGRENEDTCGGDGGSPLICLIPEQPGRWHQVGIVSWGIGCGNDNIPGVYVNLPYFRQWIDKVMLSYDFDITSYRY